jgi:uncharacterized protein YybS (DUF2232 family)
VRAERIGFFNKDVFWGILVISLAFLTVALVPFVGAVVIVLIPLPVVIFLERLGRLRGLAVLAFSLLIVQTALQSLTADVDASLFLLLAYLGVVIYEVLKKGLSIENTVFIAVIAGAGMAFLLLLLQSALAGEMPWTLVDAYITRSFQESIELSSQMGAQAEQIKIIQDNFRIITRSLLYVMPALTLVGISFISLLNIVAAKRIFLVSGSSYPDFGDLTKWKAREEIVWLLIASGMAVLIPPVAGLKVVEILVAGLNILIICLFVYFLQGLAVFEFYFKTRQVPRLLRIMFYFFLILQQYLIIFVIAAGLFDLWLYFRKLNAPPPESEG